jgi:4-hydroxy-tetrahydrodipicolinate synthase
VPSLERLVQFQLDGGVHGLFMLGSTSEGASLTSAQRRTVLETSVSATRGRVPILTGVIETSTDRVIEQAQAAQKIGVDGLVVTAPFYVRPSQDEIIAHYRAVKAAVSLPIVAYDIPSAVQSKLARETLIQLASEGTIVGVKDSSGDEANFRGLVMDTRCIEGFAAFTGSELLVDAAILVGAAGSVPGIGNVDPAGYVKLFGAARAGDWGTARIEQERLFRLFSIISVATGRLGFTAAAIGAFKTALMLRGVIATNTMSRPLSPLNDQEVACVREIMAEAGLV